MHIRSAAHYCIDLKSTNIISTQWMHKSTPTLSLDYSFISNWITVEFLYLVQGRREGGGNKFPQVLGAPTNFLLGPSHFFWWNISAQRARYLGFFWQSTEIWWIIEVKSLESNYNVLVRKNYYPKKLSTTKIVQWYHFRRWNSYKSIVKTKF